MKQNITLRKAKQNEHELMYNDEAWTKFNSPYFLYSKPTLDEFRVDGFAKLLTGETSQIREISSEPVGSVSYYWVYEPTRWLEVGIAIYNSAQWSKGAGRKALKLWTSNLFNNNEIAHVGLTTWSGNPRMIACAKAAGMSHEGTIRQVRYYEGVYYDSVKLGITRDEWQNITG